MAAHVVTALEQIKSGQVSLESLKGAVNFACWTEDLALIDYRSLHDFVTRYDGDDAMARVKIWADALYPKYRRIWEMLDRPKTREEWRARKYAR